MSDTEINSKGAGPKGPALVTSGKDFPAGEPVYSLTLWPNRSLPKVGLRWTMGLLAFGLAIPFLALFRSPVAFGLLPFLVAAFLALWFAFRRNYRDGRLHEVLKLWPELITVDRIDPKGRVQSWRANPYWVTVHMEADARPENYLTLKGNGREIELGAFLSPEEREALYTELQDALSDATRVR